MTSMKKFFKTKYNHEIEIREDYRKGCPPLFDPKEYSTDKKQTEEGAFGIICDIYEFSILIDWLTKIGYPLNKYKKLLDVGGNTGLIARLFHGYGLVAEAYCLDKSDFTDSLPMEKVMDLLKHIQKTKKDTLKLEDNNGKYTIGIAMKEIYYMIRYLFKRYLQLNQKVTYIPVTYIYNTIKICQSLLPAPFPIIMFNMNPDGDYSLSKFIHGNFYELNGKYDCITSFSSLDHFTPSDFFKKAHFLLEDDGVLLMWHCSWYYLLCPPAVYGDFPFACQRLERDDLERYFYEYYPEEKEQALRAYDYYHNGEPGYTLNDYKDIAAQNGFSLVNYHRLKPLDGKLHNKMANWEFKGDHGPSVLNEVLRDIHCFKKDVTEQDLLTHSYFLIFKKESNNATNK